MKCKRCGKEINLTIFGMPEDLCWDCLTKIEKNETLDNNINLISNVDERNIKRRKNIRSSSKR